MNKNIAKLVAAGIFLGVMSGNVVPTFAAEKAKNKSSKDMQSKVAEDNLLTLEEAINAAIANSDTLALKSKEVQLYKDKLDIQDDIDDFTHSDEDFPYDNLELLLNQKKESMEYLEDQIAQDITKKFNSLVVAEMEIAKLKKDIDIKNREISTKQLKYNLGLSTSLEIDGIKLELKSLEAKLKAKENSLKDSKGYFELLTNLDLSELKLDTTLEFKPFRIEGSVDSYMTTIVDDYMHYNEELILLQKDYLKDHKPTKPSSSSVREPNRDDYTTTTTDPDTGVDITVPDEDAYNAAMAEYRRSYEAYLTGMNTYGSYLQNKYDLNSGEVQISEGKKSLKQGLIEAYTGLKQIEDNIDLLKSQMELTNKTLEITRTQYNVGLATKLDYDTAVVKSEETEITLRNLINQYNTIVDGIQKPWILNSGSESGSQAK